MEARARAIRLSLITLKLDTCERERTSERERKGEGEEGGEKEGEKKKKGKKIVRAQYLVRDNGGNEFPRGRINESRFR